MESRYSTPWVESNLKNEIEKKDKKDKKLFSILQEYCFNFYDN